MATTVDPTTAIPKKVNVSIKDGQTISEEVLLLEIWSTGNVNGEKTIQVKDEGKSIKGTFRQIQLKFDINNNYIYTKNSDNQKLEKTYSGTASEFSISGLSTGNANTVIRTAKTSSISDLSKKYDGSAELVEVKVENPINGGVGVRAVVGVGLAVDFKSVIGQGPKPKENEFHKPKGFREELGVDQPGPDFQVDYVVEIGADRKNDNEEVSIQYDGLPHSGNNDRTGDKILFKINKGQIQYLHQIDTNNKQMFEVGEKEGVEPGKDKFEPLQKGKTYGLRVVKRNGADGKSTEHWGYMQNLTDGGPLKEVIHVIDRGQFAGDDPRTDFKKEWRVGVRIDGKNGEDDKMYTRGFVVNKI